MIKNYPLEDLLELPTINGGLRDHTKYVYDALIISPTGEILEDPKGAHEFMIVGCKTDMLIPKEIVAKVHAMHLEFLLQAITDDIKITMVGSTLFRIKSKRHRFTFNLTSSEVMDFDLIPR